MSVSSDERVRRSMGLGPVYIIIGLINLALFLMQMLTHSGSNETHYILLSLFLIWFIGGVIVTAHRIRMNRQSR